MKSKAAGVFLRTLIPLYIYIIWAIINTFTGMHLKAAFFMILTIIIYYAYLLAGGLFKFNHIYKFYSLGKPFWGEKTDWDNISASRRIWTPVCMLCIFVIAMVLLLLLKNPFTSAL